MNYNIDGLIFTPSKLQRGDEKNQILMSKDKKKVTGIDLCYSGNRKRIMNFGKNE